MYSKAMASLLECGKMLICIQADVTNFNFVSYQFMCHAHVHVQTCTISMHAYLVS